MIAADAPTRHEQVLHALGKKRPIGHLVWRHVAHDDLRVRVVATVNINALRHAEATRVNLTVALDGNRLTISVADNGKGFADPAVEPQGNGLRNMKRRLADIGGACEIRSVPGSGTTVRMQITLRGVHKNP